MSTTSPGLFGADVPAVVGHRGAPLVHAENTPASFAAAAAAGATWVEMDVRRTAEGGLAVHHDVHLPDGRAVAELDLAELRTSGVWALPDVLAELPEGLGVDLEVKNLPGDPDHDEGMAILDALALALPAAGDRPLVVSSFNPMVLLGLVERGIDVPHGLLTIGVAFDVGLETALELGCAGLFCHHTTDGLDGAAVDAAHQVGLSVMVWTVDDPATARALVDAGVDALCTNDPGGLVGTWRR